MICSLLLSCSKANIINESNLVGIWELENTINLSADDWMATSWEFFDDRTVIIFTTEFINMLSHVSGFAHNILPGIPGYWRIINENKLRIDENLFFYNQELTAMINYFDSPEYIEYLSNYEISDLEQSQISDFAENLKNIEAAGWIASAVYDIELSERGTLLTFFGSGHDYEGEYPKKAMYRKK
jgi:hypothetical protein